MADLWDRITANSENETPLVSGHYLPALFTAYHKGTAASAIKTFFNMDASAQSDFDAMTGHFDGLTALQKVEFLLVMESATVQIELGVITTKVQYTNFLGIT